MLRLICEVKVEPVVSSRHTNSSTRGDEENEDGELWYIRLPDDVKHNKPALAPSHVQFLGFSYWNVRFYACNVKLQIIYIYVQETFD